MGNPPEGINDIENDACEELFAAQGQARIVDSALMAFSLIFLTVGDEFEVSEKTRTMRISRR